MVSHGKLAMAGVLAAGLISTTVALGAHHGGHGKHKKAGTGVTHVSVAAARLGTVSSDLVLSGVVQSSGSLNLAPSVTGRVATIAVKVGQTVTRGQVVATLGDSLAQAQMAQDQAAVAAAQAKVTAAAQGASPQTIQVAQAAVAKAVQILHAAQSAYQEAQAVYQDRIPEQQPVVSAQNQVKQSEAAAQVAQAAVQEAEVKLAQAESSAQTSPANVLPSTITADHQAVAAAQAQLKNDQAALVTDEQTVQTAEATLSTDQTLYGTMAGQYSADEAAYQEALLDYNSWQGYGSNPYAATLSKTQTVAQQASQAYNTLQSDQSAVHAAQSAVADEQKNIVSDQAAVDSTQAALASAGNSLTGQQASNQLSVEAAQAAVGQAKAQAAQSAQAVQAAQADLAQAKAQYNDRTSANQTLLAAKNAVSAAQTGVQAAEAQLAAAQAPPSSAALAALQAGVSEAQAASGVLAAELRRNTIVAPFSGVVTAITDTVGALASPGAPILSMESSQMQIQAALSQNDMAAVNTGDSVTVTAPGVSATVKARVATVSPSGNSASLAFAVMVTPDQTPSWLKAGEFVSLNVLTRTVHNAVIIPSGAIVTFNGKDQVFVVGKGHKAVLETVVPGLSNGVDTQVTGVRAASRVVVSGQTYLSNGSAVRISQTLSVPSSFQGSAVGGLDSAAAPAATAAAVGKKGAGK